MAEAPDPNKNPFDEYFEQRPSLNTDVSFSEEDLEGDEKACAKETETVFKAFLFTRLTSQIDKETDGDMNLADIPSHLARNIQEEKNGFERDNENDPNTLKELGRTLAVVGDDIQKKYHKDFDQMLSKLDLQEEFAFDTFRNIARRIFDNGINWGRILSLFCFGYEIAMSFIRRGIHIRGFLGKILKYIVGFLFKEKIVKWIIEQGGWIKFKMQESDLYWTKAIGAAVLVCALSYLVYRKTQGKSD